MHAYLVTEPVVEEVEPGAPATGARTPGVKHMALVGSEGTGASAGDVVVRALTPDAPEVAAIVVVRAPTLDDLDQRSPAPGYLVAEHVMVTPSPQRDGGGRAR
jgi:hypothetical protein